MTESEVLEGQLRECFGRVVHTHKTQEICADLLLERHGLIKKWQIALSALVTGGILAALLEQWREAATVVSAILSTVLLALNAYSKDHDLSELAQKHRQAAASMWLIRERYLSLLTDLKTGALSTADCRDRRDVLMAELHSVYIGAPSTSFRAYEKAQYALKSAEDMTFADEEIDAFLPKELKRKG